MRDESVGVERSSVQIAIDSAIAGSVLRVVPYTLRPNHVTALRFALVPVVFFLFRSGRLGIAFAVFVFAVCTDFLDGAMARTRDQVTETGTFIDPLADKLLIGAALFAIGFDHLVIKVILGALAVELASMVLGAVHWARAGWVVRPNVFGKTKMVLLSVGLSLFILGKVLEHGGVVTVAVWVLWVALVFAVIAALRLVVSGPPGRGRQAGV